MYANGEQLVLQSETKTEIGQFNPLGQAYSMRIESKNNRYKNLKMLWVKVTYLFCSIHAFLNLVMELNEELFSFRNPMSPEFTITLNKIINESINLRIFYEHSGKWSCLMVGTYFINLSTRQLERNGLVWFGSK